MAFKAAGHFHPEWMVTLGQVSSKDVSMARDSRVGTHAIVQPILDVLQASQAFDGITYRKGAAVINMLEDCVGADVFRDGVRAYIAGHAYGNTVTDDLWREVDKISPRKITEIAHDFTLQDGVPLIVATPSGNDVRLTQKRFALDESGKAAHSWRVPVIARVPGTAAPWRGIVAAQTPVTIPGASAAGVLLNVGQNGYYRAQYAPALFAKLAAGFKKLPPADQLGTLYDTRMLGYSGDAPLSNLLGLAEQSEPGMDRHVLATVADRLSAIDSFYRDLPSQGTLRAFGRKVLQPVLAQTGWDPKPGESENEPLLRATLLATLSEFDDPGVIGEARRLFAEYLQHPNGHSADKRRAMLEIVALHADNATWNQLHNLAKSTSDSIQKERYYGLLGHALDPELAARALALTLSDEVAVTTRPNIIGAVSVNNPDLAFDFAIAHLDTVMSWIEPSSATTFMPGIASNSLDPKIIPKLEAYAAAHIPASARRSVTVAEGAIRFNIMVREKRLPEVDRWLARHGF
ncbi:MAG: M1 family metallopeptidase [Alphaproteobacteria bacterium]